MTNPVIYSMTTRKGGVLKTSLTTNLAGVLSREAKVLIIDTDAQGDCLLTFGINPDEIENTLYDVLMGDIPAEDAIINVAPNIDVLPSNDRLVTLDFKVIGNTEQFPEPFNLMKNYLCSVVDDYDYVLVDSPGHFGLIQGNIINFVHKMLIPFQPETYSMRSLVKILDAIAEFKNIHGSQAEVAGVIGTMVDLKTVLHSDIVSKCRQYCYEGGIKMYDTLIPKSIRYAASVAYAGKPATLSDPNHDTSLKYKYLKEEVFTNG